jgi:hypothetical protein
MSVFRLLDKVTEGTGFPREGTCRMIEAENARRLYGNVVKTISIRCEKGCTARAYREMAPSGTPFYRLHATELLARILSVGQNVRF